MDKTSKNPWYPQNTLMTIDSKERQEIQFNPCATDLLAPLGLTYSLEDNLTNGGEHGALGGQKVKVKTASNITSELTNVIFYTEEICETIFTPGKTAPQTIQDETFHAGVGYSH